MKQTRVSAISQFTSIPLISALVLSCLSLTAAVSVAAPTNWPTKPITLVIPFATGGTTDIIAREVGLKLGEALKQPVLIDNKPGAGGNLAAGIVSKAAPDGLPDCKLLAQVLT